VEAKDTIAFVGVALCIDRDHLQGLRVRLLAAFCCTA
jgi:hypothetical protein